MGDCDEPLGDFIVRENDDGSFSLTSHRGVDVDPPPSRHESQASDQHEPQSGPSQSVCSLF